MLEAPLRKIAAPWLAHAAEKAEHAGVSANAVTVLGLVLGIVGAFFLTLDLYGLGILFVFFNRICDALDGAVARLKGPTAFGGVLDSASDFVFYAGVPFGFALSHPENAIAVAFLLFGRTAFASSEYASASFAKNFKAGEEAGTQVLHGLAGLCGPPETLIFFMLMCMFPNSAGLICYIYGGLCFVAAGARVAAALGETSNS
jgi:phosphatidylglycerophosphate synthase